MSFTHADGIYEKFTSSGGTDERVPLKLIMQLLG
jgi:hypothetical protein